MVVINRNQTNLRSAIQPLLQTSNDFAAASLVFNALTVIFGFITVFGVYLTWKLYVVKRDIARQNHVSAAQAGTGTPLAGKPCTPTSHSASLN